MIKYLMAAVFALGLTSGALAQNEQCEATVGPASSTREYIETRAAAAGVALVSFEGHDLELFDAAAQATGSEPKPDTVAAILIQDPAKAPSDIEFVNAAMLNANGCSLGIFPWPVAQVKEIIKAVQAAKGQGI